MAKWQTITKTHQAYDYRIVVVGDDNTVMQVATHLNKHVGANNFNHADKNGKDNLLLFNAPVKGVPVHYILKKLGFKTKRIFNAPEKTDVRNGDENSPNESGESQVNSAADSGGTESPVLSCDGVLHSQEQDVQDSEATNERGESSDTEAHASASLGDSGTVEIGQEDRVVSL